MDAKKLSCIICRCELVPQGANKTAAVQQTSAIVCGHVFHTRCLYSWLRRNPTCPNCRHPVRNLETDIINKLYFDEDEDAKDESDEGTSGCWDGGNGQEANFGSGMALGAILTGLAVGIGYLFFGGRSGNKRQN